MICIVKLIKKLNVATFLPLDLWTLWFFKEGECAQHAIG